MCIRDRGFDAPIYANWSVKKKSALIRIPFEKEGKKWIELRSPDASANPYLALAVCLAAGMDGIERKIPVSYTHLTIDNSFYQSIVDDKQREKVKKDRKTFYKDSEVQVQSAEAKIESAYATEYQGKQIGNVTRCV